MDERTVEQMQTQMVFLERANTELSDVLYRQQQQIDQLAAQMRALSDRVNAGQLSERQRAPEEERPPHY